MTTLRVAVVGCGRAMGKGQRGTAVQVVSHAQAIADHSGLTLSSVFDQSVDESRAFAREWGASVAESWEELAATRPDILLIASPTGSHADYLRRALASGIRAVVCEKPLAPSAVEAEAILAAYRNDSRRSLYVYYPRRWISALRRLADSVAAGQFGSIQTVHGYYGNGALNIGCHLIDLLLPLLGPVKRVHAWPTRFGIPADPSPDIHLTFASGTTAVLQAYDYEHYALIELDLIFSAGRVRLTDLGFSLQVARPGPSPHYAGFRELGPPETTTTDYADAARFFWNTVHDDYRADRTIIEKNEVSTLGVIDMVRLSASSGAPIDA